MRSFQFKPIPGPSRGLCPSGALISHKPFLRDVAHFFEPKRALSPPFALQILILRALNTSIRQAYDRSTYRGWTERGWMASPKRRGRTLCEKKQRENDRPFFLRFFFTCAVYLHSGARDGVSSSRIEVMACRVSPIDGFDNWS